AHDRDRHAVGLAFDEVGCCSEFVDGAGQCHAQVVAVRIDGATQVLERLNAGEPHRGVRDADPPRPAERVTNDDAHVDAGERADVVTDPPGRCVRVDGQHYDLAFGDVRGIDTGGRHHESVPGRDDAGVTATGHDPHGLGVDGELAVDVEDLTFGLRDDLRRDDEDVTVK